MSVILEQAIAEEQSASADRAGSRGRSDPLGATTLPGGVNFSVFPRHATGVELVPFDREDDPRPARVLPLDPAENRTYHYWHLFVLGVPPGQLYGYRVHGPFDPARGLRFDPAMDDEVRRTQQGNNNAYCQDNGTSWFDWTLLATHADVLRFVRLLTAQLWLKDEEPERRRLSLNQVLRTAKIAWHGVTLGHPDWGEASHSLAFSFEASKEKLLFHAMLNAYWEPLDFELPQAGDRSQDAWRRWIDTSLDSPQDIVEWPSASPVPGRTYRAEPRSVVVLLARASDGTGPSVQ